MKKFLLIVNLIFVVLIVVFSIQNAAAVPVTFWAWKVEVSLALLMILCVVLGIILSLIVNVVNNEKKEKSENLTEDDTEAGEQQY